MAKVETHFTDKNYVHGGKMYKNNIVDMTARRKEQITKEQGHHEVDTQRADVLDMTAMRQEIISEERRRVKRTILAEFLGAYVVIPQQGLQKVNVYDISNEGLALDVEAELGHFRVGDELAMRLYLSKDTYLPFIIRISNHREITTEGLFRHGAQFVKSATNGEALSHFVKFLETVTASLQTDHGDILVTNLR